MKGETDNSIRKKFGDNIRGHNLEPEEIMEILANLNDPSYAVAQPSKNRNGYNIAFFVKYQSGNKEAFASVEFFSYVDEEHLDISHGDTDFHTVVTVFSPDTSRNNSEYDYYQELVSKDGNYDVPIKRRRTDVGNTGTILSESYKGTSSRDIIASAAQNRNSESEESYAPDPGIVKESRVSIENQIAEYEDYQTPGIHINDKGTRFTDLIFADDKDERKRLKRAGRMRMTG